MSTVQNVNGTSGSGMSAGSAQELSDRFLTMLTAQMRNQDPLNPLDNAEITSQLAQISTVTGISELNSTMQWLGYSMASLQSTQAAGLIGRQVMVVGDALKLSDGEAKGGYSLQLPVEKAEVSVKDVNGQEVARFSLSDVDAGTHTFEWDGSTLGGGTAPDGDYRFEVVVTDGADVGSAPTLSVTQVAAVRPYAGGTAIIDEHGKNIALTDVYQVW